MLRRIAVCIVALLAAPALAATDPQDQAGSKDPALFNRMKGFHIYRYEEKQFDKYEFAVAPGKTQTVEGHSIYVDYYAKEGVTHPSSIQVVRNYTTAAKGIGGVIVYEFEDGGQQYATIKVAKNDLETWVFVEGGGNGSYKIHVIEKQAMAQEIVANAEALANGIRESGKIAVYGIYFDTDKADLKPASEPTLVEIVKLLTADAKLKLYVVGHTDNQGTLDHNLKLSQARAAAVVAALTKKGIAAARLTPFGAGPTSPVVSNASDTGRAKNRRVELVAQ